MAIGSAPEIGANFQIGTAGFDWKHWRTIVGDTLMGGYATVCYPSAKSIDRIHKEWNE